MTRDVDSLFVPHGVVLEEARNVARDLGLPAWWLNEDLAALHRVIQALYGWDGDHLHAFRVRRATYSDPSFSLEETRDEYTMRVLAALNAGGGKITYEYDFGASWIHEIALQKKAPREPGTDYPFCVRYSGNSPVEYPEEGIWYSDDGEPVEAGPAKPEPLDLAAVNRRLGALEQIYR